MAKITLVSERALSVFLAILVLSFATLATEGDQSDQANVCDDSEISVPQGTAETLFADDTGKKWTDLHVIMRVSSCFPRYPTTDLQTLKNAKLTCKIKGARLPKLSEVNDLAAWLSSKYLRGLETGVPEIIEAKFMKERRHFWTATLEQESDRFVFNRALARVSTLVGNVDMSKAEAIYRPALEDNKQRPFLCVYPTDEIPDSVVVAYEEYGL